MPITAEAYAILFEGKDPASAVSALMSRDKTCEHEAEDLDDVWK
jgi:glycerol-3-phosphate dehydrogenase (NAD(P)+)